MSCPKGLFLQGLHTQDMPPDGIRRRVITDDGTTISTQRIRIRQRTIIKDELEIQLQAVDPEFLRGVSAARRGGRGATPGIGVWWVVLFHAKERELPATGMGCLLMFLIYLVGDLGIDGANRCLVEDHLAFEDQLAVFLLLAKDEHVVVEDVDAAVGHVGGGAGINVNELTVK